MFSYLLGSLGVANLGFVWSPTAIAMVALVGVLSLGGVAVIIKEICNYFGYGLPSSYTSEDEGDIKSRHQAAKQRRLERKQRKEARKAEEKAGVQDDEFVFDEPESPEVTETSETVETAETVETTETVETEEVAEETAAATSESKPRDPDEMSD